MTTDEARAALLALAPADGPFAQRLDALEAAIRADWEETARQYAENADYWRDRAEKAEAKLAALRTLLDRWEADGQGDLVSATSVRATIAATPTEDEEGRT